MKRLLVGCLLTPAVVIGAIPTGLICLKDAYPWAIASVGENNITFHDGTTMTYDEPNTPTEWKLLINHADLAAQMSQHYPLGWNYHSKLTPNYDPGRLRYQPFFEKLYGKNEAEVRRDLVSIDWMPKSGGGKLLVTKRGGVAQKFQAISDELDRLPPSYRVYLLPPGGTFIWRPIAGTKRLSMHSFGIAIDINVPKSHYWRDENPNEDAPLTYRNTIPRQIVEIFEKHGFIWGGKWYHYDTMHFEYRPELLDPRCANKP
ncbi:MAG: M15 family metallopeptidase [Campylobacterales bacterium]